MGYVHLVGTYSLCGSKPPQQTYSLLSTLKKKERKKIPNGPCLERKEYQLVKSSNGLVGCQSRKKEKRKMKHEKIRHYLLRKFCY